MQVGMALTPNSLARRKPGFKSPHLHPTTALVTGLAGHLRRVGVLPRAASGQQTGSNRQRCGQPLLEARHDALSATATVLSNVLLGS
jgi:hypothetical protein